MNLSKIRFNLADLNRDTSSLFLKKLFFEVFMSSRFLMAKVLHSHLIIGSGIVPVQLQYTLRPYPPSSKMAGKSPWIDDFSEKSSMARGFSRSTILLGKFHHDRSLFSRTLEIMVRLQESHPQINGLP